MTTRRLLLLVALLVAAVGIVVVLEQREEPASVAVEPLAPSSTPTPSPSAAPKPSRQPPRTELACRGGARDPFVPSAISVDDVTAGARVLAVPRDGNGVVGVPPLIDEGKGAFAWDAPGVAPGSPQGHALFNAHTWPDGSALGNALLAELQTGEQLVVRGAGGERLCYDVVGRQEVPAETRMPELYSGEGPPQLVVIVCSGERRGPGDWSHRTLWFAEPV